MSGRILCLTGGIGGAKLCQGLALARPDADFLFAVNQGDDFFHLGLKIWPDFDTLLYTLAGVVSKTRGWGRASESWHFHDEVSRLGLPSWFQLGDKDLAMHAYRTSLAAGGMCNCDIASELCRRFDIRYSIARAAAGDLQTCLRTDDGWLDFQEYFVKRRAEPAIREVAFKASGRPGPSRMLKAAFDDTGLQGVIIAPSNPILSIDPILAVEGVKELLIACQAPIIAISPILGGESVKGPTAKIFGDLGKEVSPLSVASHYSEFIDAIVIDQRDVRYSTEIAKLGVEPITTNILMSSHQQKADLARECLSFLSAVSTSERPH